MMKINQKKAENNIDIIFQNPLDIIWQNAIIKMAYATTRENGVYYDKVEHLGALPQS